MPALLDPPEGYGYDDYDPIAEAHRPYDDRDWKDDLLLDEGIDQMREDDMDWDSDSESE